MSNRIIIFSCLMFAIPGLAKTSPYHESTKECAPSSDCRCEKGCKCSSNFTCNCIESCKCNCRCGESCDCASNYTKNCPCNAQVA